MFGESVFGVRERKNEWKIHWRLNDGQEKRDAENQMVTERVLSTERIETNRESKSHTDV
jgi:hypothetical protein